MKKVTILGLGYIGLPTAIVSAESGMNVNGYDIDEKRVQAINEKKPVIKETGIATKLIAAIDSKRFIARTICLPADFFIITVPTPILENKKSDLSYVWNATQTIAQVLKKGNTVIVESTVPVGLTDQVALFLEKETRLKAGIDFYLAHCPERVLPGNIFYELVHNARIIGGINKESVRAAQAFYKSFVKGKLYLTDATTAEMVKLIENSSRDVAIAFANQVADMAYAKNLDPFEVIELANKHPRVNILKPSCGVGGHCIAVDPWFLVETFPNQTELLKKARQINDNKPLQVIDKVKQTINDWQKKHGKAPVILSLGLTYKPNVDDLRESPALHITKELSHLPIDLKICEPNVPEEHLQNMFGNKMINLFEGVEQADIILCLVNHEQFSEINEELIEQKVVLDYCGLFYKQHAQNDEQEQYFWPSKALQKQVLI